MRKLKMSPPQQLMFLLIWTLLVLYPNPLRLVVSVVRVANPPVSAEAVEPLAQETPGDPVRMESFVLREFPYQYDWDTYGVPWYFPTAEEAVRKGTGDCKTRFVVLASLFELHDIPYTQTVSLSHFWVDYEGKPEEGIEKSEYAWLIRDDTGTRVQMPREQLRDVWEAFREAFWEHMPPGRKLLFAMGPFLSLLLGSGRWFGKQKRGKRRSEQ